MSTMLESRFCGNETTRYRKRCEGNAIQEYTRLTTNTVTRLGLVVNPLVPRLGYSLDGVVFRDGQPHVLLEVKCHVRYSRMHDCHIAANTTIAIVSLLTSCLHSVLHSDVVTVIHR